MTKLLSIVSCALLMVSCTTPAVAPSNSSSPTQPQEASMATSENPPIADVCYMREFNPDQFPWRMDDCLNYEEVFKEWAYFETKLDKKTNELSVSHYVQGSVKDKSRYKIRKKGGGKWLLEPSKS